MATVNVGRDREALAGEKTLRHAAPTGLVVEATLREGSLRRKPRPRRSTQPKGRERVGTTMSSLGSDGSTLRDYSPLVRIVIVVMFAVLLLTLAAVPVLWVLGLL